VSARPPRIPLWLLSRLGCGSNIEALIGDLTEEYHSRPSAVWLWRQALAGIATTFRSELRAQRLLTIRARVIAAVTLVLTSQGIGTVDAPEIQNDRAVMNVQNYLRVINETSLPTVRFEQSVPIVIRVVDSPGPWPYEPGTTFRLIAGNAPR
jgi:hypothetical protein